MPSKPTSNFVRQSEIDNALLIYIDRPERGNAIGPTIAAELAVILSRLSKSLDVANTPQYRAIVLRANAADTRSGDTWVAGGDLKELAKLSQSDGTKYSQLMLRVCQQLENLPIPVIAAIGGAAIGGGAELALAADIRIGTAETRFDFKQLKVGLATGFGGTRRLVGLIGKAHAQRLLLKTESIDAHHSLALGLLHELVDDDAALDRRLAELCSHFAALDMRALAAQKWMLHQASGADTLATDRREQAKFKSLWGKHAHRAFLKSFNAE